MIRERIVVEQDSARRVNLHHVARIVRSYVRHHEIRPDQLVALIVEVHRALSGLETGAAPLALEPAVPIRQSVRRDYVVCLECGFRGHTLRRHLRVRHGLDVAAYRARWRLSPDHPVTAPAYSEQRSAISKQLGLGRRPVSREAPHPPTRRRRPRRPTTS
jgi:predicted transcriptional regulator